ncbi:MAG: hypothetical protein HC858_01190 [Brachymonas sp.]|nr:hypothetical protein [Brachymonas sp.]
MAKPMPRSTKLAALLIYAAMNLLKDAPLRSMKGSELLDLLPSQTDLDDWAVEIIESNGMPRWRTYALFFLLIQLKLAISQNLKAFGR